MNVKVLSFSDVLILPKFSFIRSRADVNPAVELMGLKLKLPVISSNMDTISESAMAIAMREHGGIGCLHRFMSIEDNVKMFQQVKLHNDKDVLVSVGVGNKELERFKALIDAGSEHFVLDLAHGASQHAVDQVKEMRKLAGSNFHLMVGNFATGDSLRAFFHHLGEFNIDAVKIGIGGGSACTTRIVTGCGLPTLESLIRCKNATSLPLIADGGIKNSGDLCKAIAIGAQAVMVGNLLSGTDETPGEIIHTSMADSRQFDGGGGIDLVLQKTAFKKYRGSASKESYAAQGKTASYIAPEGEASLVPYKGPVSEVLSSLEGGLRSSMSYLNASTIEEYRENAEFVQVTGAGIIENDAHIKSK